MVEKREDAIGQVIWEKEKVPGMRQESSQRNQIPGAYDRSHACHHLLISTF